VLEFLQGEVVKIAADAAVISVGGVGIKVQMPTPDLAGLRGVVTVYTVMHIRDDDVHVFGFETERGRALFRSLTSVSGVGPKVALAALSFHGVSGIERALVAADADAISLVPGIGRKIAQRIVLELKDKVGAAGEEIAFTGALAEVREALKGLGYAPQEIQDAVALLPADGDAPTLLRFALKALGAKELVSS
jgi:Holliday junction DNA helicase RuvA